MTKRIRTAVQSLREVRIRRVQLAGVGVVSALATALVLNSTLGSTAAQEAALAALSGGRVAASQGPAGAASNAAGSGTAPAIPVAGSPASSHSAASTGGGGSAGGSAGDTGSGVIPPDSTGSGGSTGSNNSGTNSPKPKHTVGHVFVIALSTPSYEAAWGSGSAAHYLDGTLKAKGAFLKGYQTLGPTELPDYLALVSGQAPNPDTEGDCATYAEFPTGTTPAKDGQVPGDGCIYPNTIITVADQVTAAGETWRGYIDGLTSQTCVHPNSGAVDDTPLPYAQANYDDRHNPFVYFHSLLDLGGCSENDMGLAQLPKDLKTIKSTPAYSFIAPGACQDGSAQSCSDGSPAGVAGEDQFLHEWVPAIQRSAAYKKDGVILIVFSLSGSRTGGGSAPVGALVLSRWAKAGQTVSAAYNPYSILLASEDLLGLTPLVHASGAKSFLPEALPGT